jgi:2-oxo-4-hydroxy-4-carboxy-5-ureidoimidazoline decarboxylase
MNINEFDHLDHDRKRELLTQCCGSSVWVEKMIQSPWAEDLVDLEVIAEENWWECSTEDWKEAFEHHPKIGDINSLKKKFANTAAWAANEQSGVNAAADDIILALAKGNEAYEKKFGFIFIVCATGKSAGEMLELLQTRLPNDIEDEIEIAAEEQLKITKIRLAKLFGVEQTAEQSV